MVFSSSPSTRFTGEDVDGQTEADMPELPLERYMQTYAETKAQGELEVRAAITDDFLAVSVAPHQVYGELAAALRHARTRPPPAWRRSPR